MGEHTSTRGKPSPDALCRVTQLWGARSSRVGLRVSRKRSLIIYWLRNACGLEKVREGGTPSPARETRALPEVRAQSSSSRINARPRGSAARRDGSLRVRNAAASRGQRGILEADRPQPPDVRPASCRPAC